MSEELKAAQARIACLEGEIAKRDETIARLEPQLNRAIQANYDLREELAACRVAVENCEVFRARIAELEARIVWLECEAQVNAAPVSEAKAQGVVIPPSPYMPGSQPTDFTDYELGEIHGRIAMWEEVKRLNAAPVQQPKCKTCNDNGRIGGPSFYAPDEGGEPCPDCSAPIQQVSVPDNTEKSVRHALEAAHSAIVYRGKSTPFEYALTQLTIALKLTMPKDACDE